MDLINLAKARCEDDDNNERVGGRMYPVIDWLLTVCGTRHGSGCIRMALRTLTGSNLAPCWLLAAPLDRTWPLTSEDEKSHKLVA